MLLLGDFNYPNIKWSEGQGTVNSESSEGSKFLKATQDSYLYQHVTCPTRHRINQVSNTVDLVFTNEGGMIEDIQTRPPIGKSDHIVL